MKTLPFPPAEVGFVQHTLQKSVVLSDTKFSEKPKRTLPAGARVLLATVENCGVVNHEEAGLYRTVL